MPITLSIYLSLITVFMGREWQFHPHWEDIPSYSTYWLYTILWAQVVISLSSQVSDFCHVGFIKVIPGFVHHLWSGYLTWNQLFKHTITSSVFYFIPTKLYLQPDSFLCFDYFPEGNHSLIRDLGCLGLSSRNPSISRQSPVLQDTTIWCGHVLEWWRKVQLWVNVITCIAPRVVPLIHKELANMTKFLTESNYGFFVKMANFRCSIWLTIVW